MVWLLPLDTAIASTVLTIVRLVGLLYVISIALPIWAPQCPYHTQFPIFVGLLSRLSAYIALGFLKPISALKWATHATERLKTVYSTDTRPKEGERKAALPRTEDIPTHSAHPLEWLFTSTVNASAKQIIFLSQPNWSQEFTDKDGPLMSACVDSLLRLRDCAHRMATGNTLSSTDQDDFCRWASATLPGEIWLDNYWDQLSRFAASPRSQLDSS